MALNNRYTSIQAMNRSIVAREEIHEDQEKERMKYVTHVLPKPPAGHPYYAALDHAQELKEKHTAYRKAAPRPMGDPEVNRLFSEWYSADSAAERVLEEWKGSVRTKFAEIREHIGEAAWTAFWAALPDGDAMLPVLDSKLEKIKGAQ